MTRHHCTSCGRAHELTAHHDPAAMDREAALAEQDGDGLYAAIWRARAAVTRNAPKVLRAAQRVLPCVE